MGQNVVMSRMSRFKPSDGSSGSVLPKDLQGHPPFRV